ncbi:MAG: TRAP transporter substrate-binding protein [Betaproteobacteria bacterium]|nr:TRAP transporter substrate-binding protein [Betaproteobacteria bacterium]
MVAGAHGSAKPIELKVSLFVSADNTNARLVVQLAEEVTQRSGGQLTLRLYPGEQLGPTAEQFDLVRNGVADIALVMHGTMPGRFPLTEIATLPFVVPNPISGTAALLEALPRYLAREHEGVRVLYLAANAPLAVHSHRPLRTIDDFAGQRIRFPGSNAADTLAALGAVPVSVLPLDVPSALKDGRIDGAAMTYQGAAYSRLAECVKYSTDLYANTITLGLIMNPEAYERLPAEFQAIVDEVLGPSAGRRLAKALERDVALGRDYMRAGGVTLIELGPKERKAFDAAVEPVITKTLAKLAAQGLPAQEVYDFLKASVKRALSDMRPEAQVT